MIERPGKGRECRTCRWIFIWTKESTRECGACDSWTRNKWVPDCPEGMILVIDEQGID